MNLIRSSTLAFFAVSIINYRFFLSSREDDVFDSNIAINSDFTFDSLDLDIMICFFFRLQ